MREVTHYIAETHTTVKPTELEDYQRDGVVHWVNAVAEAKELPPHPVSRNQELGWRLDPKFEDMVGKCAVSNCRLRALAKADDSPYNTSFGLYCSQQKFDSEEEAVADEQRCHDHHENAIKAFADQASQRGWAYEIAKSELEEALEGL